MGFGGGKSDPKPAPRTKPPEGTYAAPANEDPINRQLGITPPVGDSLLKPKPKSTPLIG